MRELLIEVDMKPLAKQSTRFSSKKQGSKAYTDPKYKVWQKEFILKARRQARGVKFHSHVEMRIDYIFKYNKNWPSFEARMRWTEERRDKEGYQYIEGREVKTSRPDIHDNLNKLPVDTLSEMGVLSDDKIVWKTTPRKLWGSQYGISIYLKGI